MKEVDEMTNGWEIIEKGGRDNELRIWVDGEIKFTRKAASIRYLADGAQELYKRIYNATNKEGWRYMESAIN